MAARYSQKAAAAMRRSQDLSQGPSAALGRPRPSAIRALILWCSLCEPPPSVPMDVEALDPTSCGSCGSMLSARCFKRNPINSALSSKSVLTCRVADGEMHLHYRSHSSNRDSERRESTIKHDQLRIRGVRRAILGKSSMRSNPAGQTAGGWLD